MPQSRSDAIWHLRKAMELIEGMEQRAVTPWVLDRYWVLAIKDLMIDRETVSRLQLDLSIRKARKQLQRVT